CATVSTPKQGRGDPVLLSVKNLSTEFPVKKGIVRAVEDVSFDVDQGEILAIVGESGSGKSVTSLSIMGLLAEPGHVAGGSLEFEGKDLATLSEKQYRELRGNDMAMIFQEPMTSLNPVYRVGNQIVEAIRTHEKVSKAEAKDRAVDLLRKVGIPSPEARINDYPHQMSGGMRQRVMIAMALACNPKLLIADEPTTALDVTIQAQILDLLRRLRDDTGMAVLLITHDLGVVSETADRVVVMYCGQVVEEAEVRTLFDHPMHPYTLGLLKSIPRLEDDDSKRLYMIKGMVPNPLEMPPGCHFSDRCDSCMDICRTKVPELVDVDGHKVRCFLYESADGEVKSEEAIARAEAEALADVEAAREVETAEALLAAEDLREAEIEEIEKEEEASR
ncbi:MAG: ABC transporter ATP-binding protein, partial [Eggerthella sp.]|nr:ABC transporter ATP-binding protein [Eggerthella sp.]